jgi:hypothetical protein
MPKYYDEAPLDEFGETTASTEADRVAASRELYLHSVSVVDGLYIQVCTRSLSGVI